MLGGKLCQLLGPRFETFATFRSSPPPVEGVFGRVRELAPIDGTQFASVEKAFEIARPEVVVSAIGIVKQLPEATIPSRSQTNSLLPHQVDDLCRRVGARLIHVSTDCAFSGKKGNYVETDFPDATDLYERTKLLGEVVDSPTAITLRRSVVGRELITRHGLVEWFLSQTGCRVRGYAGVVFSGLTTTALSKLIGELIESHPNLTGLWHVSSDPITKYDFLVLLDRAFGTRTGIYRDLSIRSDHSLDSRWFWSATGLMQPHWETMIEQLRADRTPYPAIARAQVVSSDA